MEEKQKSLQLFAGFFTTCRVDFLSLLSDSQIFRNDPLLAD